MPTIQIDDEVQIALVNLAVRKGMDVFSPKTPNLVLRIELGVGHTTNSSITPAPLESEATPIPATVNGTRPQGELRTHQKIGPRLLREHGLDCKRGYFHKDGIAYQKPYGYPVVFFGPDGYLIVKDEASMRSNPYINVGKQVSIPRGIYSVPGYVRCQHVHS